MASIETERVGPRLYVTGNTYPIRDRLKALGCHWDGERRQWWIGVKKAPAVAALVALANAPADESATTAASARAAEVLGLRPDTPAGVVADRLEELGQTREADRLRRPPEDPHNIRLTGRGRYQGREYYAGALTRDGTRVRLLTLPDADGHYLDFWAPCAEVEPTKRYEPREVWDGRRYSGWTRTEYPTLGSIAAFLAQQRDPATRRGQCPECGQWGPAGEPCSGCGGEGSYL